MKFGRERTTIRKDGEDVGNRKHLNFQGSGVTVADDGPTDEVDVTISGGGGGGGAPLDASYVVFGSHVDLTNEKLLGADVNMAGTEAARPAAATAGRYYFATDTLRLFRDTGSAWTLVSVQTLSEMAGVLTDGQIPASIARDSELHAQAHSISGADHTGTLTDGQIPGTIARDSELHAEVHGDAQHPVMGRMAVKRKATDETITLSLTLQDDDDLFFDIGANEVWPFYMAIILNSSTTGDFRYNFAVPAGASGWFHTPSSATIGTIGGADLIQATTGVDLARIISGAIANGGTAGQVKFQWAQQTVDAGNTIVRANSFLIAHRFM